MHSSRSLKARGLWQHIQTLRFRLALLSLIVFGLIITGLSVVILSVRERHLRWDFDDRLQDRAEAIIEEVLSNRHEAGVANDNDYDFTSLKPYRFRGYYYQLRRADGMVIHRSPRLRNRELPLSELARTGRESQEPVLETVTGGIAQELFGVEGKLRLLTIRRQGQGLPAFYLQVGASLKRVENSIHSLRVVFLSVIPAALLIAGIASWLLAGRSLSPIARIAEAADELGVENLTRRFDQPRGRDEVANMVATINAMLDRLSTAFQAQSRFIADVSHEIKTPLSIILGEAQVLMQRERGPEEYARFVASVQDEVRSLAQTVDSVLTLARAEAGLPLTEAAEVSVNEVVTDAAERCQPVAKQREVRLVPRLALPHGDKPEPLVWGDGGLLRLMIVNLVRNAVRYSPPDEAVDITVELKGDEATLTVRDRGPGIPGEYVDKVFDRFFCVPHQKQSFKGIGLGLTIARGIARLHEGTVSVSNRPEGGCEFVVRLPLITAKESHRD
jgi:two-component system OmpR family sensor kinase